MNEPSKFELDTLDVLVTRCVVNLTNGFSCLTDNVGILLKIHSDSRDTLFNKEDSFDVLFHFHLAVYLDISERIGGNQYGSLCLHWVEKFRCSRHVLDLSHSLVFYAHVSVGRVRPLKHHTRRDVIGQGESKGESILTCRQNMFWESLNDNR